MDNLGVICATEREFMLIKTDMEQDKDVHCEKIGFREFYMGKLQDLNCVLARCGVGKVSSAVTTSMLIQKYNCSRILFIGVAGSLSPEVSVGDVVIATDCLQHDVDVRPWYKQHVIPSLCVANIPSDTDLSRIAKASAEAYLESSQFRTTVTPDVIQLLDMRATPFVKEGTVVCGDQFITDRSIKNSIVARVDGALCVEMEGGAVAQTCNELGVGYGLVRVISDSCDDASHGTFEDFCNKAAGHMTRGILLMILAHPDLKTLLKHVE
eukprot:gnl/Dysnectes_brevis/230_a261_7103.p1 GENE.gnl/Dysnectes_brevis/230_a261_7103~~gnl/Dysnectes_brevis/230_a261_7103.p1  ORF type:complete len:267 (-),score=60.12 gnl/Dysnectes_brevis/230_a261_7103:41-841(-)